MINDIGKFIIKFFNYNKKEIVIFIILTIILFIVLNEWLYSDITFEQGKGEILLLVVISIVISLFIIMIILRPIYKLAANLKNKNESDNNKKKSSKTDRIIKKKDKK